MRLAEANLARSRAAAMGAHKFVERLRAAAEQSVMSARELEAAEAKAQVADAEVQASVAAVDTAKLDLGYCTISAPMAGRLGQFLVRPRATVKSRAERAMDDIGGEVAVTK